ncbi:peptidoglycan-binding domain-containing protein [Roseivirga sp.]|uniref:peptidoglycan-binding domain-containing protein n=1 Tax=Roseivirga sp. TaxID=1964215 RepID=UPI003B51C209
MKRLIFIVLLIGIGSYIAVQYLKDRRFNPPSGYDYVISTEIDTDFYDKTVVQQYYKLAYDAGSYARSLWFNDGIDVRMMDRENHESTQATDYYNKLLAAAKQLEDQLEYSKTLRDQGLTKEQIRVVFEQGLTPDDIKFEMHSELVGLKIGDNGARVWELQKLLNTQGDSIPEDGIFNILTRQRLRTFQQSNQLFPSGEVDTKTLKALLK